MDDIIIRQALPTDIPRLCGLLEDLFSLESDFTPDVEKQILGLSMLVTDLTGAAFVAVAVKGIEIIGMATIQKLVSTAEGGRVGLIEDVIVRKDLRGKGVGTLLLDAVVDWSRGMKLKRLQLLADLDNRPALDFYRARAWSATRLICLRKML